MSPRVLLRMQDIEHSYGACRALKGVDFTLYRGEIHALAGDHRAGKTTLGKVLAGVEKLQRGKIFIDGGEVAGLSIKRAINLGIGMVYQDESLIPSMNAVDNIFCGFQPNFFVGKRDLRSMEAESLRLLGLFGVSVPLDEPFYKLTEKDKQIIHICHVLSRKPRILVIDEIGTTMQPSEMDLVFDILRRERERGTSIIYITSNFGDVFKIADRVTILKDGIRKGTEDVRALDPARLIDLAFTTVISTGPDPERSIVVDSLQESIIEELPLGEIILDDSGRTILINKQAFRLLPPATGEYKGKRLSKVFTQLEPADMERIAAAIREPAASDVEGVAAGGRTLKFTLCPILDHKKRDRIGTNIFIEDLSFTYQTNEYLIEANKAASVAELAAGVAHEIKNPLAIIQNYVELMKMPMAPGEREDYLGRIERELRRITEIIGDLLSFSCMKQPQFGPVKPAMLLDEVLLLLSHKISEKRIRLVRDYEGSAMVNADENKLKQLFMNILDNAIDAVLDEGSIRVATSDRSAENAVAVLISDNGHGIPNDIREKIFDPFFSTKMSRTNIGLGLSICQNIVSIHRGVIKLISMPDWKTSFEIILPALRRREDE